MTCSILSYTAFATQDILLNAVEDFAEEIEEQHSNFRLNNSDIENELFADDIPSFDVQRVTDSDKIELYDPNKEYNIGDVVYINSPNEDTVELFSNLTATYVGKCQKEWKNTYGYERSFYYNPGDCYGDPTVTIWSLGQTW